MFSGAGNGGKPTGVKNHKDNPQQAIFDGAPGLIYIWSM